MLVFGVLAFFANEATAATGLGGLLVGLLVLAHRAVARRPDGLRDQPGPRPRAADHARDPADPGQGPVGLGLRVDPGGRADHRRRPRRRLERSSRSARVVSGRHRQVPPRTSRRGEPDGQVRGSARPGHHEHALHDLRPRRQGRQRRAEGARADLSRSRAGSSTTRRRSGRARQEVIDEALELGRRERRRHRRRSASPTSARRRWCGTATPASRCYNAIVWQDTRTDKLVDEFSRDGGQDRFQEQVGPAAGDLLLGPEDPLDPRQRRRRARAGRVRRPAVRQHGHLVHLEPHRRHRRRPAHHRRRRTPAARC